jgi:UDP-glucose 4-epimerase
VFNIGNGEEVSIRQLAKMVIAKTGSASPIRFVPHHEVFGHNFEDMSRRVPDIGKLQQLTGYEPSVDLDEILERVIDYWSPELPPLGSAAEAPFWHEPGELFVH